MDPMVLRAMAKWPNVPDIYDWLSLDRRGVWRLRGEPIGHRGSIEFINRNYEADQYGRWYFQNGPQRVFVGLEYTPFVIMRDPTGRLACHTGRELGDLSAALLDDEGNLLLSGGFGVGLVLDRDLAGVADQMVDGADRPLEEAAMARLADGDSNRLQLRLGEQLLLVESIRRDQVASRFGFVPNPKPRG